MFFIAHNSIIMDANDTRALLQLMSIQIWNTSWLILMNLSLLGVKYCQQTYLLCEIDLKEGLDSIHQAVGSICGCDNDNVLTLKVIQFSLNCLPSACCTGNALGSILKLYSP